MYCISFIVLLAGFGYCAGNVPKCDARVAAGVSKLNQGPLKKWTEHSNLAISSKECSWGCRKCCNMQFMECFVKLSRGP